MKLRTTLVRPAAGAGTDAEDIVITADGDATVGDLAHTLATVDPRGAGEAAGELTLEAFGTIAQGPGEVLDAAASIAHVQLAAGSAVRVVPAGYQSRQRVGELTIVSGPVGRSTRTVR